MFEASNERPKDVKILAVLEILVGFSNILFPHYFLILTFQTIFGIIFDWGIFWLISVSMVGRILGIISLVLGWGLWTRKQWAYKVTFFVAILEIVDILVSVPLFPNNNLIDPLQIMRRGLMRFGGRLGPVIGTLIMRLGLSFIILFNIIINGVILYYLTRPPIRNVFDILLPTDVISLTALEYFAGLYSILFNYYIYRKLLENGIYPNISILFLVITGFCNLVVGYGLWAFKNQAYQGAMILAIIGILTALFHLGYLYPLLITQGIIIYYLTQPEIKDLFRISDKSIHQLINGVLLLVILVLPLAVAFVEGSWEGIILWYLVPSFIHFICLKEGPRVCFPGWLGLAATIVLGVLYRKNKWTVVTILQVYVLSIMMSLFYTKNLYYAMYISMMIMFLFLLFASYPKSLISQRN